MNTMICYLYRDASNYKQAEAAVVVGEGVTQEQLLACCDKEAGDSNGFIPSQAGLEDLQSRSKGFPNEDDHVWHELEMVKPTKQKPTLDLTAAQLLKNFQLAKDAWKVTDAMKRLGMLPE
jgi:hypothetical protein